MSELVKCRVCRKDVSSDAASCPNCGARAPGDASWKGWGFEWRSRMTIFAYPLIHIAFGKDRYNKWRVAKGVIAIGQAGIGIVTFAQFGIGVFTIAQFAVGFRVIAQFGVGNDLIAQFGLAFSNGAGQFIFTVKDLLFR